MWLPLLWLTMKLRLHWSLSCFKSPAYRIPWTPWWLALNHWRWAGGGLTIIARASNVTLFPPPAQWHHIGRLKSAMVGEITPWALANSKSKVLFLFWKLFSVHTWIGQWKLLAGDQNEGRKIKIYHLWSLLSSRAPFLKASPQFPSTVPSCRPDSQSALTWDMLTLFHPWLFSTIILSLLVSGCLCTLHTV